MDIVVETLDNEIVSDWSFKGYIGALNAGHSVEKSSLTKVSMNQQKYKEKKPMPVGSHGYMEYFFWLYGIETPKPLNIPSFINVGRKCWTVDKKSDLEYPVFVKPLVDAKKFTGFVAKKESDFDLYPELKDWDGPYFCSEVIKDEILSEWRWFTLNNKILNVSNYTGDPTLFPTLKEISEVFSVVIEHMSKLPKAYTIDMGCTIGDKVNWHIIELNRAYSTAPYGINEDKYFKFLKAYWNEMVKYKI